MNRIDEFIDSLYEHVAGSDREIAELKEEMKAHLLETVNELKAQGRSEEESIDIALERFGDRKHLAKGLLDLFKVQKRYALTLVRIGLVSFLLAVVIWVGVSLWDNYNRAWPTRLTQEILTVIEKDSALSEATINRLNQIADKYHAAKTVVIYKSQDIKTRELKQNENKLVVDENLFIALGRPQYLYPANNVMEYPTKFGRVWQHDANWWVEVRYRVVITDMFYRIAIGLFMISLAIMAIWFVTNAYYKRIKQLTA